MKNIHLFWLVPVCIAAGFLLFLLTNGIDVNIIYNELQAQQAIDALNGFNCSRLG
ncbi:hypothetical protein D1BOALGB6SA_5966 [Olavius sp. associated proteobacterium Delta 1]|nr:hypothetical protein D1BOALGB6SA_5966 [Olavius sp. associated proteobacterium Delta 1]